MQLGEVQLLWLDLKMVEANKIIEAFIKLWFVSRSGPCRIPASRDWTQIPVPRFSKLNPGIFRDCVWHINQCFPRLVLVFRQLKSLLGTPRTFHSATNVYSADLSSYISWVLLFVNLLFIFIISDKVDNDEDGRIMPMANLSERWWWS